MIPKYRAAYKDKIFEVTEIKFCQGKLSYVAGHDGTRWYYVEYLELSDLILMQSIGLKDIFQDDIVSFSLISDPETAHIGVVFYDQACLGWMIRSSTIPTSIEENEIFYPTGMVSMALILQGYVESIGNIHQHKELLEEEAQEETK